MFLRHTWLVTILGTLVLGAVIWAAVYYTNKATITRIAAGPSASSNAKLVAVLGKSLAQSRDKIELQLVSTDGAKASVQALSGGNADLAIVPSTLGNSPDWPVVAILRQNVIAFIVPAPPPPPAAATPGAKASTPAATPAAKKAAATKPAKSSKSTKSSKSAKASTKNSKSAKASDSDNADDSDSADDSDDDGKLKKVTQLAGKRVGVVTGNEATADLLDLVLNHYGVPLAQVQVSQIDPKDIFDAVKANKVDVLFVAGAATGQAVDDAVTAATQNGAPPTFIDIDQADGISKRNPAFDSISVDAGTFGGNPPMPADDLSTLSFAEYLVARKSFSHSTITELAKAIYTSRLGIASQMAGEVKIEAPSTDKDADTLVHQGALDYLNDNSQDFFDKYGNDIFYGMLIFPVFGSAIAGVASYLRSDSRTRRLRLLQRVLDLVRKAHAAQTLEALEQLQIDADNLVISIVHLSEHEEFDESVRMSFSFALDQLRFAVAGRRTAILDHTGVGDTDSAGNGSGAVADAKAAAA